MPNFTFQRRKTSWRGAHVCAVACLILALGCAQTPVDPPPPPPPEPRIEPAPGAIAAELYERLRFAIFDENDVPLQADWTVSGAPQGQFYEFLYQPIVPGDAEVRATFVHGGKTHEPVWPLSVSDINTSETPPVTVLRLEPADEPGGVEILWERPPGSLIEVPLDRFFVYWSDQPFAADELGLANELIRPIDRSRIEQSYIIRNLVEEQPAYVRIVIEDALDRLSTPSVLASAPSTGHYDVRGSLKFVLALQDVAPMVNALVEVGELRSVTASDGRFEFLAQPAYPTFPGYTPPPGPILRASDASGVNFYDIVSRFNLPMVDQQFDLLMLKREVLPILPVNPGDPNLIDLLDFLTIMTRNVRVSNVLDVPHWEEYPVTVYAPSLLLQGANELVDYRAAFAAAVSGWNLAAGEELLRLADESEMPGVGVEYRVDLGPEDNLGETLLVQPVGGNLFRSIPELIRIRLRSFSTQVFADKIIQHEMGHALGLWHSPSLDHAMEGSVPVPTVHRDEALMARIIRHMPQRMDLRWYLQPEKRVLRFEPSKGPRVCGTGHAEWEELR